MIHSIAYRPAPEGGDNPVEGAFIFTHGDYYYLFASYDYCCKGLASNYYVAVGRSKSITGPYQGRDGKSMMDGYGTAVIVERPWASTRWRGPGHCGLCMMVSAISSSITPTTRKTKQCPRYALRRSTGAPTAGLVLSSKGPPQAVRENLERAYELRPRRRDGPLRHENITDIEIR